MRIRKLLFVLIIAWIKIYAQTVYEPVNSDLYPLLESLFIKGAIEYHSEIKPIPRKEIAEHLHDALANKEKLTKIDIEEIDFYLKDLADEVSFITDTVHFKLPRVDFFTTGQTGSFRFFNSRAR